LNSLVYCTYSKGVIFKISPEVRQRGHWESTTALGTGKNSSAELLYFILELISLLYVQ